MEFVRFMRLLHRLQLAQCTINDITDANVEPTFYVTIGIERWSSENVWNIPQDAEYYTFYRCDCCFVYTNYLRWNHLLVLLWKYFLLSTLLLCVVLATAYVWHFEWRTHRVYLYIYAINRKCDNAWWINQRMYLTGCQSFSVRERLNKMNRILFQQPLFTDSKAVTTIREHSLESTCFSLVNNLQFNPLGISILLDFQPDKLFDATYIYAMFDLHFTIRNSIDNYLYLSEYLYKCIVYIFNNSISLWCDVVIKYIDDLIMIPYFSSKVNKNSSEHRISP